MIPRTIHMHFSVVNGTDSRLAVSTAAAYIAGPHRDDGGAENCLENALAYLDATGHHRKDRERVAATLFLCRGDLPRARVWRELDQSFRTKTGAYSRKGGNRCKNGDDFRSSGAPRLALFMDALLPPELSERQKLELGRKLAQDHVDRYGCAVEVAWHAKDGKIDHVHFLVTTREIDQAGVGKVIRDFNGIASKCDGNLRDGKKRLAGHAEWARQNFAAQLTEATGILFDPRSFRRQGRAETPVPWITRERLERDKADGTNSSMDHRKRLLSARAAQAAAKNDGSTSLERSTGLEGPAGAAMIATGAIGTLLASASVLGHRPTSVSQAIGPKALSLNDVRDEDRAILIQRDVDDLCRAEAIEERWEDREREAQAIRRLAAQEQNREIAERTLISPSSQKILDPEPQPARGRIDCDEHVSASPPTHRFGLEEDDDEEKAKKKRRSVLIENGTSSRKPSASLGEEIGSGDVVRKAVEFSLVSEGSPEGTMTPTRKGTSPWVLQSGHAGDDHEAKRSALSRPAKHPIQKTTSATSRPVAPAISLSAPSSPRQTPSQPHATRPPTPAPSPASTLPPAGPHQRPPTTSSPLSSSASRDIAVAMGAYILRRTQRYHLAERLADLAGLDRDAYRRAVNEQTANLSSVPVDRMAEQVSNLIKSSAGPQLSTSWSRILQRTSGTKERHHSRAFKKNARASDVANGETRNTGRPE